MQSDLTTQNLTCEREQRLLFAGLDLNLRSGEVLQVTGPNGCGKTSLLRILAGLAWPTAGEVYWRGQVLSACRVDYQTSLAYVGHLSGIKAELTARENCEFVAALAVNNKINIDEVLAAVGMEAFADHLVRHLSAGQKQRIALTRLLILQAPLWILDEPLTALDKVGIELITQLMQNHITSGGMMMVTSHQALNLDVDLKQLQLNDYAH